MLRHTTSCGLVFEVKYFIWRRDYGLAKCQGFIQVGEWCCRKDLTKRLKAVLAVLAVQAYVSMY